jgi:hypothetical protein
MVNLFPHLAVRYQASDVPATVANGRTIVLGSAPEADYVEAIARAAG